MRISSEKHTSELKSILGKLQCCGSKYIEFGSGSMVMLSILKIFLKKLRSKTNSLKKISLFLKQEENNGAGRNFEWVEGPESWIFVFNLLSLFIPLSPVWIQICIRLMDPDPLSYCIRIKNTDKLIYRDCLFQCCGAEIIYFWLRLHFFSYIGSGSSSGSSRIFTVKNETKNFCETTFKLYSQS